VQRVFRGRRRRGRRGGGGKRVDVDVDVDTLDALDYFLSGHISIWRASGRPPNVKANARVQGALVRCWGTVPPCRTDDVAGRAANSLYGGYSRCTVLRTLYRPSLHRKMGRSLPFYDASYYSLYQVQHSYCTESTAGIHISKHAVLYCPSLGRTVSTYLCTSSRCCRPYD